MPICAIKWCGKRSTTSSFSKDGISFHKFPSDAYYKELWLQATKREKFFPTKFSTVCSRHFGPECFKDVKNRRRLIDTAVPEFFLPCLNPTPDVATQNLDKNDEELTIREKQLKRKNHHLTLKLLKKNKEIKRLQDKSRKLTIKVAKLEEILNALNNFIK